ncbi:MAG TPA: CheR family methyltransferase, partial [Candidatus Wallbacteria bacterium]|nr:CheR family methyltransferase [Candidatus Wallbacteria bacterium]
INKYFDRQKSLAPHSEEKYIVKPQFKKMVKFRRHNLKENMSLMKFDCIFCRNVLIYFDNESKTHVIENLYNALNDDGYLILGHAESLMRIKSKFKYVRPSVYKR